MARLPIEKQPSLSRSFVNCSFRRGPSIWSPSMRLSSVANLIRFQELLKGARAVKAQHGDLDGLITKLEAAAKKAQG